MGEPFPPIRFRGKLRPSQREVVEIAQGKLRRGGKRLYIVAPPGSGKTILGLYLWAEMVRRPALVLSPNSAIQAQWAAKTELFDIPPTAQGVVSTDPTRPGLLTSLTYQAVTLPRRGGDDIDAQAIELWQDTLVAKGQAKDPAEAATWIDDLRRHNPDYYGQRLAAYRKDVRDAMAMGGDALKTLHASATANLKRLRDYGIGLIIFDECHHLMGHWGRVLAEAHELLEEPVVVGLTATPPDERGKKPQDIQRYTSFFGPVDYEVPVPAVVKDGFLAPYQDLAYFVRPASDELAYVAKADEELHALVEELCAPPQDEATGEPSVEPLPSWLLRVLNTRQLPTGRMRNWTAFEHRDPDFATAARLFLLSCRIPLPKGVPEPELDVPLAEIPEMAVLVPVLDRYIRHRLRRSDSPADHKLAERAIARLRMLGVQITETGSQPCASPVGRVMAYSRSKMDGLVPILKAEKQALGDQIRAVVVTDHEKSSAVAADVGNPLDEEAGGAVAAFRTLLTDPETDALDPVLVTGSTVLVDDDLAPMFADRAKAWLAEKGCDVELTFHDQEGFKLLRGSGGDWCPRVYVSLITDLFQEGLTRCLVGTRGLLGEGWDAEKVNVLVDLTSVTTSTSVRQLRGRSIRLDPDDPEKLANNWDVVCVAPEFSKGFDDYGRFIDKHRTVFGLTDDGAIEKGVGHVHAAFTELKPEGIEGSMGLLNSDMVGRTGRRVEFRTMWRIGEPYSPEPIHALQARPIRAGGRVGFPPYRLATDPWSGSSLTLAVGEAVLGALRAARLIRGRCQVAAGDRAGGYVRVFLKDASEADSALFTGSLAEALGPLRRPRYVVPRYVEYREHSWLSRILPDVVGRYLQRRTREMAMLHAVPTELARHKSLVTIYEKWWNKYVSPGAAVYAHRGAGEELVDQMLREGRVPRGEVHKKEIFL